MIYHPCYTESIRAYNHFRTEELQLRHESAYSVNYLCYFIPVGNLLISPHTCGLIHNLSLYIPEFIIQHIIFLKAVRLSLCKCAKRLSFILVKDEKCISNNRIVTEFIKYDEIQYSVIYDIRSYHFFLDYNCSPVTFKFCL